MAVCYKMHCSISIGVENGIFIQPIEVESRKLHVFLKHFKPHFISQARPEVSMM